LLVAPLIFVFTGASPNFRRIFMREESARRLDMIVANVPYELKALEQWVPMRIMKVGGKQQKRPIDVDMSEMSRAVNGLNHVWAKSNDPTTWTSFDKAVSWARNNGGFAVALAIRNTEYSCIDLDKCKVAHSVSPLSRMLYDKLQSVTYIERSASGKGLHFIFKDKLLKDADDKMYKQNAKCKDTRVWRKEVGNEIGISEPDIEVLEEWEFVTFTGNVISKTNTVAACPPEVKKFVQGLVGEREEVRVFTQPAVPLNKSERDVIESIKRSKKATEFEQMFAGQNISEDWSRTDLKMLSLLAFFTGNDRNQMSSIYMQSGLYAELQKRSKVKGKGKDYIERTIEKAINFQKVQYTGKSNRGR